MAPGTPMCEVLTTTSGTRENGVNGETEWEKGGSQNKGTHHQLSQVWPQHQQHVLVDILQPFQAYFTELRKFGIIKY